MEEDGSFYEASSPSDIIPRVLGTHWRSPMTITLEATYEKGQLKFKKPLALAEGTTVRVTIASLNEDDPFADIIGICHSGRRDVAAHHDRYLNTKRPRD